MSFLSEFFSQFTNLPKSTRLNLEKIRDNDSKQKNIGIQTDKIKKKIYKSIEKKGRKNKYLQNKLEKERLLQIESNQKKYIKLAQEKIDIANTIYEDIERDIHKIDLTMKQLEDDLTKGAEEITHLKNELKLKQIRNLRKKSKNNYKKEGKKKKKLLKNAKNILLNKTILQAEELIKPLEWEIPVNINEPKYCYCSRVSYGEMLACDNPFCEKEWFHFDCLGISTKPKGKWYCKNCKEDFNDY